MVSTDEDINSLNLAEALAVLQKLKAVSPALARLVQDAVGSEIQARPATDSEARHGKDKEWPELTAEEQAAAGTLGYTQSGWEAGDEPVVCTILWAELAQAMRNAALALGYEQSSWDYELETTPEEAAPSAVLLPPAAPAAPPPPQLAAAPPAQQPVSVFPAPPAPPEQDLDFGENVVAGKDKLWPDLTNAERISATNLGFDQTMWDAGDAPEACAIPFAQLNTTFKISAQALGYTQATWDAELPEADEPPPPPPQQTLPPRPRTPPPPQQPAQRQPQASPGQSFPPLGGAPAAHDFPALGGGQSRPQTAPQRLAPAPQPSPAQGGDDGWETVSVPRGNVARSGLGASVGAASTRAGDGNQLSAASQENNRFSSGYIFGCKPETYNENMSRQLFGALTLTLTLPLPLSLSLSLSLSSTPRCDQAAHARHPEHLAIERTLPLQLQYQGEPQPSRGSRHPQPSAAPQPQPSAAPQSQSSAAPQPQPSASPDPHPPALSLPLTPPLDSSPLQMLHGVFVPNGPGGLNLEPEAWKAHAGAGKIATRNRAESGSPYPAQIRFNILKRCEPMHYRVWGHIATPKPQGFNQFELHLDADQATKLAAMLMSRR